MKLVLLSGGTGTPKLLQGFMEVLEPREISVVVNTGEDKWLPHGYFSPDMDTVMYTLGGVIDEGTWHGIAGDSFFTHHRLRALGGREFLRIGDQDRATHILRGELLKEGYTLEEATRIIAQGMGIESRLLPMTNDRVETVVVTPRGELDLHEYLVKWKAEPQVEKVYYRNVENSTAPRQVVDEIEGADLIVLGPSNPTSSMGPLLAIPGLNSLLRLHRDKGIAVSPLIGETPISGPADRFMRANGHHPSPGGVAEYYSSYISKFITHRTDILELEGIENYSTNIVMRGLEEKKELAEFILELRD